MTVKAELETGADEEAAGDEENAEDDKIPAEDDEEDTGVWLRI